MEFSIVQTGEHTWELRAPDGAVVDTFTDKGDRTGYDLALGSLGTRIREQLAAESTQGGDPGDGDDESASLLPERWTSVDGIAFSVETGDGRDFTNCAWSWRDPAAVAVPFMDLAETTEYGHLGAILAGFVEEFHLSSGTVMASGRFYNNSAGVGLRDRMAAGPPIGVSVDATAQVDVEFHDECTAWDDDGFCESYDYRLEFTAYEIGGLTACPIPAFENAAVTIDSANSIAASASVTAPADPPREWMLLAEPQLGEPFLDGQGDDYLVEQIDQRTGAQAGWAVPLTTLDNGQIFGHLTYWTQCHVAEPWGRGVCAAASRAKDGYRGFMSGSTHCADGSSVPSGVLTLGCEHSSAMNISGVQDHLAHAGLGVARVRIVDGEYGPWISGVVNQELTDSQIRLLRALTPSGEWPQSGLLAGVVMVNSGGLPIQRLAASAGLGERIPAAQLRVKTKGGEVDRMIGSMLVRRCPECEERRRLGVSRQGGGRDGFSTADRRMLQTLMTRVGVLDRRTAHLNADAARALEDELTR